MIHVRRTLRRTRSCCPNIRGASSWHGLPSKFLSRAPQIHLRYQQQLKMKMMSATTTLMQPRTLAIGTPQTEVDSRPADVLPPFHPDHLHLNFSESMQRLAQPYTLQQLYTSDGTQIVTIPALFIEHYPRSRLHIKKLLLCRDHHSGAASGGCTRGLRCKAVHVALDATAIALLPRSTVHEIERQKVIGGARCPPGRTITVAPPAADRLPRDASGTTCGGGRAPPAVAESLPTDALLLTRALRRMDIPTQHGVECVVVSAAAPGVRLRHCAHFFYNRRCFLGPECRFVHAIPVGIDCPEHSEAQAAAGAVIATRATPDVGLEASDASGEYPRSPTTASRTSTPAPSCCPHHSDVLADHRSPSGEHKRASSDSSDRTPRRSPRPFRHNPYRPVKFEAF